MMRYFMAIDVQNLWYSCRQSYGTTFRVDYKALLDFVFDSVATDTDPTINATAYLVISSNHDQTTFINALRQLNFNVKKRHVNFTGNRSVQNSNWDVGITADAITHAEDYDKFVLVSGDGDFIYLVEPLRSLGKEVVVISFEQSLSRSLRVAANEVHYIGENIVYSPRERYERRLDDETDHSLAH